MIEQSSYHGMQSFNPETANIRYYLLPSDNATLYRKFSRRNRVDVRRKPEYNIHDWLNPESPHFQPEVHRAIFHYAARSKAGEHFEVCISTPEMETAICPPFPDDLRWDIWCLHILSAPLHCSCSGWTAKRCTYCIFSFLGTYRESGNTCRL